MGHIRTIKSKRTTELAERNQQKLITKEEEYTLIAGDFNFIIDTKLDKRGGNIHKGTIGRKTQRK